MKDEMPLYPITEDEAKSALFDMNKIIEINGNSLREGKNQIYVNMSASWGRHYNIEPTTISAVSNKLQIARI